MKRVTKVLGLIVLAVLVGLSVTACDTNSPAYDPGPSGPPPDPGPAPGVHPPSLTGSPIAGSQGLRLDKLAFTEAGDWR